MPRVPPTSSRIPLGTGLTIHALTWNEAAAHTVIVLHGFLDFAWSMAPLVEAGLAERFHVIVPDARGHGDSDRVGAGGYYHFADYLADLDELVRLRAHDTLSIVGHSMGGSIAAYYTGSFPARVHRLALLEGIGPPEAAPTGPDRVRTWLESWRRIRETPPRAIPTLADAAARLRRHDPLLDAQLALTLAEQGTILLPDGTRRFKHDPLHATMGPYGGFQHDVALRFWSAITCPTLLVDGGASSFVHGADEAARRKSAFRDARHIVLPGAGHMMQRHQPAALARILLDFLP